MNEQYFNMKHVTVPCPGFWFMLKLRLFGKRIEERAGPYIAVWYAYRGMLYMVRYSAWWV